MSVNDLRWFRLLGVRLAVAIVVTTAAIACAPSAVRASLYAVTDAGIAFESTNNGVTWAAKGQVPEPSVVALSPGLTVGQLYALGENGSLNKSTSAGAAWSAVGNVGASDCVSLTIARGGNLIALTRSGDVARSSNGGVSWTTTSTVGASDCAALTIGGKAGVIDTLFAITSSGDVAISPTGASWTNVGTAGYTPIVDLLWITKTLYALTDAGEILKSSNNGATWAAIATISQVGMRDLAYVGGKFKAIAKEGEVYESTTGASWSSSWIGTTNQVFTVAFAPGVPEFLTGVESPTTPTALSLRAWPNPFTGEVRFALSVGGEGAEPSANTEITVFDAAGRAVARLFSGPRAAVPKDLAWRAAGAGSGIYFAMVRSGKLSETERLVLLR